MHTSLCLGGGGGIVAIESRDKRRNRGCYNIATNGTKGGPRYYRSKQDKKITAKRNTHCGNYGVIERRK